MKHLEALRAFTYAGRGYTVGQRFLATERGARELLAQKLVRELSEAEIDHRVGAHRVEQGKQS
jgi:hypothetical protein